MGVEHNCRKGDATEVNWVSMRQPGFFKRLHIDPTINVGHILTTLTMIVAVFWWANSVETRLNDRETEARVLTEKVVEIQNTATTDRTNTRADLIEVRREIKDDLREIKQDIKELNRNLRTAVTKR